MTQVTILISKPLIDGTYQPVCGWMRWTPSVSQVVDGSPDNLVLPIGFDVPLNGAQTVIDAAPTGPGWAWQVVVNVPYMARTTTYYTVPSSGPVAFADLVAVDPATLTPVAVPEAAWWAVANDNVISGAVVSGNLILTQYGGGTINAGNVQGPQGVANDASVETIFANPASATVTQTNKLYDRAGMAAALSIVFGG